MCGLLSGGVQLTQSFGGERFILEFGVGFFERNVVILAGCETAVRVQRDALGGNIFESLLNALDNLLRRVDLREAAFRKLSDASFGASRTRETNQIRSLAFGLCR